MNEDLIRSDIPVLLGVELKYKVENKISSLKNEFSYSDILINARNLLVECISLMDSPKELSARLSLLDESNNNEVSNLIYLYEKASDLDISCIYLEDLPWRSKIKIVDLYKAKKFFNDPSNDLQFQDLGNFLLTIYSLRNAYFHLRLEMEKNILIYSNVDIKYINSLLENLI